MKIINCKDYEAMSLKGAKVLMETIIAKPDAVICIATGGSPLRMYELVVNEINDKRIDISNITFLKLDEWYGVKPEEACTCTKFIKEHLLDKLYMQPNYVEFISNGDVDTELKKIDDFITQRPIDLMILGLGMNGHLGLNEPSDKLNYKCHQAKLNEKTKTHDMAKGFCLESGLTIGLEGIFQAKQVLMLVTGERKEEAYKSFMSQTITTTLPASLLWLHQNCMTLVDEAQFKAC